MKNPLKFNLPRMSAGCGGALLRNPAAPAQATAVADALAALAERDDAFLSADPNLVAQFMTDDYLQTDIHGLVQDKKAWLAAYYCPLAAEMKAGRLRWDLFQRSELKTRLMNNVVVIIGNLRYRCTTESASAPPRAADLLHFTHVWAMRDTRWKLAVVHNAASPVSGGPGLPRNG
jgi:ketosteroid isomerase-like protein